MSLTDRKPKETHTPPACRNSMPGIDYRKLRERIPMSQVLELLGFQPRRQNREQLRGPCPIHGSSDPRSDIFAVHLGKQRTTVMAAMRLAIS